MDELYSDVKRLKALMKTLDKADGKQDNIIHKSIALEHIASLRKKGDKRHTVAFLDAVAKFIEQGPETQRRLSNDEIDAIAQMLAKK